jgi:hypothetical protein
MTTLTRKYKGKTYHGIHGTTAKSHAQTIAKIQRKNGILARVVKVSPKKSGWNFVVVTRPKWRKK